MLVGAALGVGFGVGVVDVRGREVTFCMVCPVLCANLVMYNL